MCFYIHPDHQDVKVATNPIKCYKVLMGNNRSPYMGLLYKKNKLVKSELGEIYYLPDPLGRVEVGLHTYSSKRKALRCAALILEFDKNPKVVEMFIPVCCSYRYNGRSTGARYYYNPDSEEYVSDHLFTGNLQPIS